MTQNGSPVVWALGDGIPGHLSHSRGLIAAVERLTPIRVEWIETRFRWSGARPILRAILNRSGKTAPPFLAGLFHDFREPSGPPPSLILSSGGRTSFLNALLAARHGCPNLFAGTLRGLRETLFTAHVTPFPVSGAARNLVVPVPLTDLDQEQARREGQALRRDRHLGERELWCLLAGGTAPGYAFDAEDWCNLGLAMNDLARRHGIGWLVATSRRSGAEADRLLREILSADVVADAAWYATDRRPVVKGYLGAASRVFCTEDSMSMLGEGAAAGRPVYALAPRRAEAKGRNALILARLSADRRLTRLTMEGLAAGDDLPPLDSFTLLERSPVDGLAEQLRPLLPDFGR